MTSREKAFLKNNNLVIFSASTGGKEIYALLKKMNVKPVAFCDNDDKKYGEAFCGRRIISPKALLNAYNKKGAVVIIASRSYYDAIYNQLISLGIKDEHILSYSLIKRLTPVMYSEEQLKQLKSIMLEILIIVHEICERNNLNYYICFGTLLGAVRHKGFIPWDDDVDIYMLRRDYDRFFNICEKELPDGFGIRRDFESCDGLYSIYRKGTVKLSPWYHYESTVDNYGISIDFFPLDNIRTKNGLLQRLQDTADIVLMTAYRKKIKQRYPVYRLYHVSAALSLLPPKTILRIREKITTLLNNKKTDYLFYFFGNPDLIIQRTYRRECFSKKIMLEFEGHNFWAPAGYKEILSQNYGENYMELPPESERITHSSLKLVLK